MENIMRTLIESGITIEMICKELSKMSQEVVDIIIDNMNPELVTLIAEFAIRDIEANEDYDDTEEYGDSTIDIVVRMGRLDTVCELLDVENPIKDKGEMLISEMPITLLYKITKLRDAISDKIAYETKHSDYYGMFDYCDYYIETEIDLNTVLAIADELIRKTAKE
jgi:hypothetical protein